MKTKALALAKDLSARSTIKIKVGAVVYNKREIISWGWNNPGLGYGEHAEFMAIRRINIRAIQYPDLPIFIAVYSSRKGKPITSRPCKECEKIIRSIGIRGVNYFRKEELEGEFVSYEVSEVYV